MKNSETYYCLEHFELLKVLKARNVLSNNNCLPAREKVTEKKDRKNKSVKRI